MYYIRYTHNKSCALTFSMLLFSVTLPEASNLGGKPLAFVNDWSRLLNFMEVNSALFLGLVVVFN